MVKTSCAKICLNSSGETKHKSLVHPFTPFTFHHTIGMDNVADFWQGDFSETLSIDDVTKNRSFGKDRGSNPTPTEEQTREIDRLAAKIYSKSGSKVTPKKVDDDEETLVFELGAKPRVILFDGRVMKRNQNSLIQASSRRHLFLLNDALLVTSIHTADSLFKSTEKLAIHQIFYLEQIAFMDMANYHPDDTTFSLGIMYGDRLYQFMAESESDKKIWLEELEAATFAIMAEKKRLKPGWHHEIIRGTLPSSAYMGDADLLRAHIKRLHGDDTVDIPDEAGMIPLHWAVLTGNIEIVRELLDAGSHIDALNNGLNSPLHIAASRGYEEIFMLLLDRGADFRVRNMKDRDALWMAVLYGHKSRGLYQIIHALRLKGVEVNLRDSSGCTPLHECASRNLAKPVRVLVDTGADVNLKHGRSGLTPLQMACSIRDPDAETVRSFLEKGAHPNWRDSSGYSAFDLVLRTYSVSATLLLLRSQPVIALHQNLRSQLFLLDCFSGSDEESIVVANIDWHQWRGGARGPHRVLRADRAARAHGDREKGRTLYGGDRGAPPALVQGE